MNNKMELSISKDHLIMLNYDVIGASMSGVTKHPQQDMKDLCIKMIKAIPESIADCWLILTDYHGKLPNYITQFNLKPHDAYWQNWGIDLVE